MTQALADPVAMLADLQRRLPRLRIEVRATRRSLMGLRRTSLGGLVLRVHPTMLLDPDCSVSVAEWMHRRGRGGPGEHLRRVLHTASARMAAAAATTSATWAAACPILGPEADHSAGRERLLRHAAERIHASWFADLPPVPVAWGRRPPGRRLSHLRFGCYRRTTRAIELSPRLARPWVATAFLEHVVHHEYCHHRQAMTPTLRREGVHSPRFRTWERQFPDFDSAIRWERLALPWLLDDSHPPWYPATGDTTCATSLDSLLAPG